MKQHTLQEICDFFGCFGAINPKEQKALLSPNAMSLDDGIFYDWPDEMADESIMAINPKLVSDFSIHDPRVLVRPKE